MTGVLEAPVFEGYAYAYPHKTAYREIAPAVPLEELWRAERRDALFLYVHVPFCEFRCGFCNLFTQSHPQASFVERYLEALERQARVVRDAVNGRYARFAVGGGTPTILDARGLERVFDIAAAFGAEGVPTSVEMSPDTVTPEKLRLLRARGVTRASLGVQTFVEAEALAVSRPQKTERVLEALTLVREAGFPTLNVDLIYGLPGQTRASWLESVARALEFEPEEVYLYPLYVRPLTGLGVSGRRWDDERLELLRAGRDLLQGRGYEAVSLRMFQKKGRAETTAYCCQEDGMVGLGCGARSYTSRVHYSSEWAVGARGVREILEAWVAREGFGVADWGFVLDGDERRRRFAIQSLLQREGLAPARWERRFGTPLVEDLPKLTELVEDGLAEWRSGTLALTEAGLERSDAIGPWLYSERVRSLMAEFALR